MGTHGRVFLGGVCVRFACCDGCSAAWSELNCPRQHRTPTTVPSVVRHRHRAKVKERTEENGGRFFSTSRLFSLYDKQNVFFLSVGKKIYCECVCVCLESGWTRTPFIRRLWTDLSDLLVLLCFFVLFCFSSRHPFWSCLIVCLVLPNIPSNHTG